MIFKKEQSLLSAVSKNGNVEKGIPKETACFEHRVTATGFELDFSL